MKEIWKTIDNRYSISSLGRVKSNYANKERILKPFKDQRGYLMVNLHMISINKTISVHRLVALAFIPNPNNLPEVNHKDENKENNCVDNLEWCDTKYNCNYGTRNQRKGEKCRKKIFSVDKYGNILHYISRDEASDQTGIDATNISKALSDNYSKNKTAGGYLWFYDDDVTLNYVLENNIKAITNKKKIYSVDEKGNIEYFIFTADAKRKTNINNISRALKNGTISGGRYWYYE